MKFKKNVLFKIISVVITISQLTSMMNIGTFAITDEGHNQVKEDAVSVKTMNISDKNEPITPVHELIPIFKSDKYDISEKIQIQFDETEIIDYNFVSDGVIVTQENKDTMTFEITATDEFGYVDFYADYGNNEIVKNTVYTYKDNDAVYISDISKDRAWYNCMESKYNEGLITMEEWKDNYSELSKSFYQEDTDDNNQKKISSQISAQSTSKTTIVTGRLRWELENGKRLPLRQTKVELRDKEPIGSRIIATTYTNDDGYFTFTFNNSDAWYDLENGGLDVFIRWYTESQVVWVAQDLVYTFNYMDSYVVENVSTGSTTSFNYCVLFDDSNNVNKSFYVQQGMVLGQRFARAMGFNDNNLKTQVLFPVPQEGAFCYYGYTVIGNKYFDDFDTLVHEYGHFVEQIMGNYGASLIEIVNNSPNHSSSDDNFKEKNEKEYAMELTWSEAWATAFSQIAQEYYSDEYIGVPGFADHHDGFDCELFQTDYNSGEAQERTVIAFLWDLYDGGTNEHFDNISLGYTSWWNYTTKKGTCTLTDFINVIEEYCPNLRGDIGAIMAAYQISPGNLTITNKSKVSSDIPPILSWKVNGSINNPNNRFQVVFYDNYNNYIYSTSNIINTQAYNTTFTYSIPQGVWNQVLKNYGGTFTINIAVRAYHSKDPISGPYISQYAPVTLTVHKELSIPDSNRYIENIIKLDKGSYCDFTICFATGGNKLIQTFGTNDTVLELYSSDGKLLLGKNDTDDKGYSRNAMISYKFTANTKYTVRVKYYSSFISGYTKLAIVPTYNHDYYEKAYGPYGTTTVSWSLSNDNVALFRYQFDTTGDVVFTMSSDTDTYLYLIDPASTEPIVFSSGASKNSPNLYNDDSAGNMQARIIKTVEANKQYLAIISFYNPHTMSGTFSINSSYSGQ